MTDARGPRDHEPTSTASDPPNLVLRHLQGVRRELEVVLERQTRDRELILRALNSLGEVRTDINNLRGDLILMENRILSNQDEILRVIRRLDAAEVPEEG